MTYYMYLSISGENKIAIYTMDPETGKLSFQEDVLLDAGPAPLATDPTQQYLYAGIRSTPEVLSFCIDASTGKIEPFATVTFKSDPCYLSTDNTGRFLLSAHYSGGLIGVHPIGEDGAAYGPPIEWIETQQCAHFTETDPSNKYTFLPHVNISNVIYQYKFDEQTGKLTPNDPATVPQPKNTGPRHYVYHPSLNVVYVDNEQGSSVTAYHFDPAKGTLSPFQTLSTLPKGYRTTSIRKILVKGASRNTCAQIHIDPQGRFVYASNRGHNSIACFSIDQTTGELTSIGQTPTEKTPRAFNIDPTGNFLYAAGQGSGNLAGYRIDQQSGALTPLEIYAVGENPSWVMILEMA